MTIRRSALAALFALPLVLTACGGDDQDPAPTTSSATSTTTSTTSITTSSTPSETPEPEPVAEEPAAEPYVVECLEGTPGPALWSDGSMDHSDDCWYQNGGPEYAQEEGDATARFWEEHPEMLNQPDPATVPIPDGGTCPAYLCGYGHDAEGNPNPSSGEIQGRTMCQDGTIQDPEYCAAIEDVFDANLDYE